MSEQQTNTEASAPETPKQRGPNGFQEGQKKAKLSRRTIRTLARKKRKLKLQTNPEAAKTYFDAKSKRSTARKAAFRKSKSGKKSTTTG